ncbi:hypothetical protein BJF85_00285 [Saccharomonospora sp. CUA-673]|nr:hypothetical protein BJF85_00285 [Saccharomonospora sp. CUA-673]
MSADSGTSEQEVVVQETSATEPETSEQLVEAEPTTVEQPAEPQLPPQVQQAVRSAESYLEFSAFSKEGLIQQLSSPAGEGYPKDVAIQAVDTLDVDWNEQAAESAQNYLEYSAFSCTGLIQQLSSSAGEQFTEEQATYGAHQTDACA